MHCVACEEEEKERNGTDTEKLRQDVNPPTVKVRLFGLFLFHHFGTTDGGGGAGVTLTDLRV